MGKLGQRAARPGLQRLIEPSLPDGQWLSGCRPHACSTCRGALLVWEEDGHRMWKCSMCGRLEYQQAVEPMKPKAVYHKDPNNKGKGHRRKGAQ